MIVTAHGFSCFRLQVGETVLALDPFGKGEDLPAPRFEAAIALVSDAGETQKLSLGGNPLVFITPGEYDVRDIAIVGFGTPQGTVFFIEWEEIRMLHLGKAVSKESLERVFTVGETVDILFAPAGGPTSEMQKFVNQTNPRIVIPTSPKGSTKNSFSALIKELGETPERTERLTIKQKNLSQEETRLVILEAARA